MVFKSVQADHAYCRVSHRETEHASRLGESTRERLKTRATGCWIRGYSIESNQSKRSPLVVDLFADRPNTQLSQYLSWCTDLLSIWVSKMAKGERVCTPPPPVCLIKKYLNTKLRKRQRLSPAWQTQPYYPMLLALSIRYYNLNFKIYRYAAIVGQSDAPTNKNQSSDMKRFRKIKKQEDFQNKLPTCWQ